MRTRALAAFALATLPLTVGGCGATELEDGEAPNGGTSVGTPNTVVEPTNTVPTTTATIPTNTPPPVGTMIPFDPGFTPPSIAPPSGTGGGDGTGGGGDGTGGGGDGTGGGLPSEPWETDGFPTCADLLGEGAVMLMLPRGKNGTFKGGDGVSITVVFAGNTKVDWKSSKPMKATGVRGGTKTKVYPWPAGAEGGTGLTTPSGQELDHVMFCWLPT